jgi:hypothetical protein
LTSGGLCSTEDHLTEKQVTSATSSASELVRLRISMIQCNVILNDHHMYELLAGNSDYQSSFLKTTIAGDSRTLTEPPDRVAC